MRWSCHLDSAGWSDNDHPLTGMDVFAVLRRFTQMRLQLSWWRERTTFYILLFLARIFLCMLYFQGTLATRKRGKNVGVESWGITDVTALVLRRKGSSYRNLRVWAFAAYQGFEGESIPIQWWNCPKQRGIFFFVVLLTVWFTSNRLHETLLISLFKTSFCAGFVRTVQHM